MAMITFSYILKIFLNQHFVVVVVFLKIHGRLHGPCLSNPNCTIARQHKSKIHYVLSP